MFLFFVVAVETRCVTTPCRVFLQDLAANVKVWLYAPNPPSFDPNVIVMFSLATLCVVTGAYLSATAHHHKKYVMGVGGAGGSTLLTKF